ncbi:hypothetical protein ACWGNN_01160 [Streptomyces sp. NPDC055817]
MARLQILELPEGASDDRPPFALVVDEHEPPLYPADVNDPNPFGSVAEKIGARAVLAFESTVDIPANDTSAHLGELKVASSDSRTERAGQAEAKLKALFDEAAELQKQLDEARQWARHGYEIGQRHCSWSDHGVAPAWLTEGWPRSFDSCEHLQQAAEFDEALTKVRNLSTEPEVMNASQPHPEVWRDGYRSGVLAARSATRPRDEKTSKP